DRRRPSSGHRFEGEHLHRADDGRDAEARDQRCGAAVEAEPRPREGFVRVSYAIVFVSDMKRAVGFYRAVIGLPLRFESPEWTEFATEGATLALHGGEAPNQASQNVRTAGRCRPGLSVPNLDDFHKRMIDHRVPCLQEPRETFGARIAQYEDPDGLA